MLLLRYRHIIVVLIHMCLLFRLSLVRFVVDWRFVILFWLFFIVLIPTKCSQYKYVEKITICSTLRYYATCPFHIFHTSFVSQNKQ